jgi:prepilin-type N-terminal cleavage/methylation domain-containing protein
VTRARGGFTLIEVVAVVLLTGILIGFTTNFYLDLSRASSEAVERARNARRAVVLLDRVARDLESAVLVRKPEAMDPLAHPWLFLAESDEPDQGASRLKFTSFGRRPRSDAAAESDFEMVSWLVERGEHDDLELRRWSSPRLPESRDLAFPSADESETVADRLAAFGVFLVGEDGTRVARWDSTTLVDTSELPVSAEIQVSFYADEDNQAVDGPYVRRVALPLRPLDVERQLQLAGAGQAGVDADGDGIPDAEEDEDGDGVPDGEQDEDGDGVPDGQDDDLAEGGEGGMTAAECVAMNPNLLAGLDAADPALQATIQSLLGRPASEVAALLGIGLPPNCQ